MVCPVASAWQKSGRAPAKRSGPAIGKPEIRFGGSSGIRFGGPAPEPLQRLDSLTPEQRDHVLGELPRDRRERLEQRLDEYHSLTPEERTRLDRQYQWFTHLPEERQNAVRKVFQKFIKLPPDRQDVRARRSRPDPCDVQFRSQDAAGQRQFQIEVQQARARDHRGHDGRASGIARAPALLSPSATQAAIKPAIMYFECLNCGP